MFLVPGQASSWQSPLAQSGRELHHSVGVGQSPAHSPCRSPWALHPGSSAVCGAYSGAGTCPSDASLLWCPGCFAGQGPPQILWLLTFPCVCCSLFWGITALRDAPSGRKGWQEVLAGACCVPQLCSGVNRGRLRTQLFHGSHDLSFVPLLLPEMPF